MPGQENIPRVSPVDASSSPLRQTSPVPSEYIQAGPPGTSVPQYGFAPGRFPADIPVASDDEGEDIDGEFSDADADIEFTDDEEDGAYPAFPLHTGSPDDEGEDIDNEFADADADIEFTDDEGDPQALSIPPNAFVPTLPQVSQLTPTPPVSEPGKTAPRQPIQPGPNAFPRRKPRKTLPQPGSKGTAPDDAKKTGEPKTEKKVLTKKRIIALAGSVLLAVGVAVFALLLPGEQNSDGEPINEEETANFISDIIDAVTTSDSENLEYTPAPEIDTTHYRAEATADAVARDDGKLHKSFNRNCGYSYTEHTYSHDAEEEELPLYDQYFDDHRKFKISLSSKWPVFEGFDTAQILNDKIQEEAMKTANLYYLHVTKESLAYLHTYFREGMTATVISNLDYAVCYNNKDVISIMFEDRMALGNAQNQQMWPRVINFNIKTGKFYEFDDVLTIDEEMAAAWYDAWQNTEITQFGIALRPELIDSLVQRKVINNHVNAEPFFFLDGDGRVNFAARYMWYLAPQSEEDKENMSAGYQRGNGWHDVALNDALLAKNQKDSDLWGLIPKQGKLALAEVASNQQ